MPVKSTSWFDDVAVMDVLGAAFVVLPMADGGVSARSACRNSTALRWSAAKAGGRFAALSILEADRRLSQVGI
jgi:hypothetical protein